MRKIIIEIETDSTKPIEVIKSDLAQEIHCCWNYFDTETMEVKEGGNTPNTWWVGGDT